MPADLPVRGFVYHVRTGALRELAIPASSKTTKKAKEDGSWRR
jgi:hypothetical protein